MFLASTQSFGQLQGLNITVLWCQTTIYGQQLMVGTHIPYYTPHSNTGSLAVQALYSLSPPIVLKYPNYRQIPEYTMRREGEQPKHLSTNYLVRHPENCMVSKNWVKNGTGRANVTNCPYFRYNRSVIVVLNATISNLSPAQKPIVFVQFSLSSQVWEKSRVHWRMPLTHHHPFPLFHNL